MNIKQCQDCCPHLPGTTESLPFGPQTLAFKVLGKMYATSNLKEEQPRVNLKCDPNLAIELREPYPSVAPSYCRNKRHWNTVSPNELADYSQLD